MRQYRLLFVFVLAAMVATGCQDRQKEPEMQEGISENDEAVEVDKEAAEEKKKLEVELVDREGIAVGIATLTEKSDGVHIDVSAHHLAEGMHGFHIHEKGICESPDFESAGGHFNPDGKEHGFDNPEGPHAGDMENLKVETDGTVEHTVINDRVTLEKGVGHSLFTEEGTTLIIHVDADDYASQPAGDAGDRIVCGTISKGEK